MAPRRLTAAEDAFVRKWVPEMFYFMKMMRRANRFLIRIPEDVYMAAYKQVSNSGIVAGGEWGSDRHPEDTTYGTPRREDSEAYIDNMKRVIRSHPILSPSNAVLVFFVGNAGSSAISKTLVIEQSRRVRMKFWDEVHALNNADLQQVLEDEARHNPLPANDDVVDRNIDRDPNERPINDPFIRSQSLPSNIQVSRRHWHRFEKIRQTFFVRDEDNDTGYTAFELAGVLLLEAGKFYKIRYESNIDSIQVTQKEFFAMIDDGMWV